KHKKISSNSNDFTVLIFGDFFGHKLLPEVDLKYCNSSKPIKIIRSNMFKHFDLVIIHFTEIKKFVDLYRKYGKFNKETMVIFSLESPANIRIDIDFEVLQKIFVLQTSNYYKSSSIPARYGHFIYKKNYSLKNSVTSDDFKTRKNACLAIISNCDLKYNIRLEYITELKKYYDVDLYGRCNNKKISVEERLKLFKKYKYFLSFENSVCQEYTTEKLILPLRYGMIPIVMNPPGDKNELLFPNSYINVFEFKSPDHLALRLKNISDDYQEYRKFFNWKREYTLQDDRYLVDRCSMINYTSKEGNLNGKNDETLFKLTDKSLCYTSESLKKILLPHF
ncbi:hypothetical protein MXB_2738, partial [Myxobolus squamalis]